MIFAPPILPELHPVTEADVEALENKARVPDALRAFWLESGYGFFTHDANGERFNQAAANRLLHPGDILELIENPTAQDRERLSIGLPFFEKLDMECLVVREDGSVADIAPSGSAYEIASNLDDFLTRLVGNPLFCEQEPKTGCRRATARESALHPGRR